MQKRNYQKEYKNYHMKPTQILRRTSRNKAREIMRKIYGNKINRMDIDHIDMNPRNNNLNNLRIMSIHKNRSRNR
jgi:hypothetical protein